MPGFLLTKQVFFTVVGESVKMRSHKKEMISVNIYFLWWFAPAPCHLVDHYKKKENHVGEN